jgi:hypothetical protein
MSPVGKVNDCGEPTQREHETGAPDSYGANPIPVCSCC